MEDATLATGQWLAVHSLERVKCLCLCGSVYVYVTVSVLSHHGLLTKTFLRSNYMPVGKYLLFQT